MIAASSTTATSFEQSFDRVVGWVLTHRYQGYEPADGNSSLLFPLTGGRVLPMRVLQQVVLRAPFNIRPWLGIRRHDSAIGRGYLALGFLRRHSASPSPELRDEAIRCLDWLVANRVRTADFSWGDPYEYATRSGRRRLGEPILVWTAFIGGAFLDAYELLRDTRYLDIAASVGRWILSLPRERTATGDCLSYAGYYQSSIHNANVVGAAFLARLAAATTDRTAADVARSAMIYTCSRQRDDGAWFYAERPQFHWVDNFHTGYNLSALHAYERATGDTSFRPALSKGLEYFLDHFFEHDGRPKYFDGATYPTDIQCAAQAIDTLAVLSDRAPDCLDRAVAVAEWTIANMQDPDGHFYYRDLGWTKVTVPMLHWGQGTMIKALAVLLATMSSSDRRTSHA
jgi:hypothetical protein